MSQLEKNGPSTWRALTSDRNWAKSKTWNRTSPIPRLARSMLATASMAGWFSGLSGNHRSSGPLQQPAGPGRVEAAQPAGVRARARHQRVDHRMRRLPRAVVDGFDDGLSVDGQ